MDDDDAYVVTGGGLKLGGVVHKDKKKKKKKHKKGKARWFWVFVF
jgi:hypothetical protein